MVNLTPRLLALASEIKEGETMADIGTDHGFLPAFLWEKSICPHVIMADVSPGSLEKAKNNCSQRFSETTQFDFRLGDGSSGIRLGRGGCSSHSRYGRHFNDRNYGKRPGKIPLL